MSIKRIALLCISFLLLSCACISCTGLSFETPNTWRVQGKVLNILSDISFVYNDNVIYICNFEMTRVLDKLVLPGILKNYYKYDARDLLLLCDDNGKNTLINFTIYVSYEGKKISFVKSEKRYSFVVNGDNIGFYKYMPSFKDKLIVLYDNGEKTSIYYYNTDGLLVSSYKHNKRLHFVGDGVMGWIYLYGVDDMYIYLIATPEKWGVRLIEKYSDEPCSKLVMENNKKDQVYFVTTEFFIFYADGILYKCRRYGSSGNLDINRFTVSDTQSILSDNIIHTIDGTYYFDSDSNGTFLSKLPSDIEVIMMFSHRNDLLSFLAKINNQYYFLVADNQEHKNISFLKLYPLHFEGKVDGVRVKHEDDEQIYTDEIVLYNDKNVYLCNELLEDAYPSKILTLFPYEEP